MKGKNRRKEEMGRKRRRIIKIDKSRSIVNKIKMLQMIGKVNSIIHGTAILTLFVPRCIAIYNII